MALDDPEAALKEFKRLNATFKPVLAHEAGAGHPAARLFVKYPARLAMELWPLYAGWPARYAFMLNISGYGQLLTPFGVRPPKELTLSSSTGSAPSW